MTSWNHRHVGGNGQITFVGVAELVMVSSSNTVSKL